jgi:rare lipoprotein A
MWGKAAPDRTIRTVSIGTGVCNVAPHLLAALLAASMLCAFAAPAKANTAPAAKPIDNGTTAPTSAKALSGRSINLDPIASDETAELLRTKLTPAAEVLTRWGFRNLVRNSPLLGAASTYNPYKPGDHSGGFQTSSGEAYEANAWAAAIQIDLRQTFGGVRYGRNYRPAFALVTAGEKCVIVKINDVGPLRPGRIIDLNERTMRYFDATLERGIIPDVKINPLEGTEWRSGPLEDGPALPMAGDVLPATIH